MSEPFAFFGGIDFSGAKEPLANLWSAVGTEREGRLRILSLRPHAYRLDLAAYLTRHWRAELDAPEGPILWGVDFPFGVPQAVAVTLGSGSDWAKLVDWVADRPADEVRAAAGDTARSLRVADAGGALAPLDLRLYKQTVEGMRWLQELRDEHEISVHPQAVRRGSPETLIEVYPSATVQELGIPRRRAPSRPGEVRARAAALRTYLDFDNAELEAIAVTLEDPWDATIACLTAYLCRADLDQPFRVSTAPVSTIRCEGWIYRPPTSLA